MLKVINPATGEVIQELKQDTPQTLKEKFDKVQEAQREWAEVPLAKRKAKISAFQRLAAEKLETLAQILTSEVGKPIAQSRNEIRALGDRIQFFIDNVDETLADESVFSSSASPAMHEKITYEPLGVIANISAWNYPYFVGSNVFIPALLAGNGVLYKPSEFSPLSGMAIADLLYEAGVPTDLFVPLIGGGAVGAELLKLPINGVFFTGSHGTGKKIAQEVAPRLIKVQLELGGKDPTYVAEDVDVASAAASLADGAFYNTGQSCCSVERIYVQSRAYEGFCQEFEKNVRGFKIGSPTDDTTYIGPLAREQQIKVLEAQVHDAVAKGGKLVLGGKRMDRKGAYFEPTVILNASNQMTLMREESFGPIIGIMPVTGDDEAVRLMNDNEYGLTAGVYTKDRSRAERIMKRLNAGSVYWNCCDRVSPRLPWTGRRNSGLGSTLSWHGILAFTQPKGWHLRSPS